MRNKILDIGFKEENFLAEGVIDLKCCDDHNDIDKENLPLYQHQA